MFNKEKSYFKKKLQGVQCTIWDLEFKRAKTKQIREEVRVEFDTLKSKIELVNSQIKTQKEKPTMPEGDIKRLDDEVVRMKADIERYQGQMKQLDLDIDGSRPTADLPDGAIGINHQLESLRELKVMLKDYLSKI